MCRIALGIRFDPERVAEAVPSLRKEGCDRATFRAGRNLVLKRILSEASVLTMLNLLSTVNARLPASPFLENHGAWHAIVSQCLCMGHLGSDSSIPSTGASVYLWISPCPVGGQMAFEHG